MKLYGLDVVIPLEGIAMTVRLEFEATDLVDAVTKGKELLSDVFNKEEVTEFEVFGAQELVEDGE